MNTTQSKLMICGLLFVLTLVSGVILSESGKPYGTGIFTVHKLIAVGMMVLIGLHYRRLSQSIDTNMLNVVSMATTGLLFLVMVITGALLSLNVSLQPVLRIHQIVPVLVLISATLSLSLLVSNQPAALKGILR